MRRPGVIPIFFVLACRPVGSFVLRPSSESHIPPAARLNRRGGCVRGRPASGVLEEEIYRTRNRQGAYAVRCVLVFLKTYCCRVGIVEPRSASLKTTSQHERLHTCTVCTDGALCVDSWRVAHNFNYFPLRKRDSSSKAFSYFGRSPDSGGALCGPSV